MKENSFYSASLESAVGRFSPQERITAWALVSEILRAHPEYGNHIGGKLNSSEGPPQGDLRTVGEWLNGLTRLFNMDRVQKEVEVLDGRLAIWGLAQLDPVLKSYLDSFDLLSAISEEFKNEKHIPPAELVQRSVRTDQIFAPNQEIPYDPSQEFERVRALSDEFEKSKALGELLRNAPDNMRSEMAHDALAVAREFSNPSSRIDAIVQVLPFLREDVRVDAAREAFAAASMIEDPSTRLYSLRVILDGLPEENRPQVAREAVALASQVEDPYTRVMTLFQLLPDLPEELKA